MVSVPHPKVSSQLAALPEQVQRWNERYRVIEAGLRETPGLTVVERPPEEHFVGSSIQFLLSGWPAEKVENVVSGCAQRGVELKWFGAAEPKAFTSRYDSWKYAPSSPMPESDRVLSAILDMRVPLTFSEEDCDLIARIIRSEVSAVFQSEPA